MMSIDISPLEVMVLKKLVLINHALAKTLSDGAGDSRGAGREQASLVSVLNDITLRADLDNKTARTSPQAKGD